MIGIPLLILALAAGVYLLMKATKEYLGPVFKGLAWLVIILSVLAMAAGIVRGVRHHRHCGMMGNHCQMEKEVIIKECTPGHCSGDSAMGNCNMHSGMGNCPMHSGMGACPMQCDSTMNKEACQKMCSERGKAGCCMEKGEQGGMKECCKKKQ